MEPEIRIRELDVDGVKVVAHVEIGVGGQAVLRHLEISGEHITTNTVRRLPIARIEALAASCADQSDLETFNGRRPGESSAELSRRVAMAYLAAVTITSKPANELAERAGVPVGTVRGWIREARLRGLLPDGQPGRAG